MSDTTHARPLFGGHATPVKVPGGCLDCDAFQVLVEESPGMYRLTVHHDATCPSYRAMSEDR